MKKRTNWTEDLVRSEAKLYGNRSHFAKHSHGAFLWAKRHGIIDDLFAVGVRVAERKKPLAKQEVVSIAKRYGNIGDFRKAHPGAYEIARKGGYIRALFTPKTTRVWTEETIRKAAIGFKSRSDFSKAFQAAADNARQLGILDELFPPKVRRNITDEEVTAAMANYSTRREFATADPGNYGIAVKRGLINAIPSMVTNWDEAAIREEAIGCTKRSHLNNKSPSAYNAARASGLLEKLFPIAHVPSGPKKWTRDAIKSEAAKYKRKSDFAIGAPGAHVAAVKYKMLGELFPENDNAYGIRDVVYIWRSDGDLFKVGITSSNIDKKRVIDVSRSGGVPVREIVLMAKVEDVNVAYSIERKLKQLGKRHQFERKFSGHSEFRVLSENELQFASSLIRKHAVSYVN